MGITNERCKCHASLAMYMGLHKGFVHFEVGLKLGHIEATQAFACWIGDYGGLLSTVDAARSRIAISLLAVPQ